MSSWSGRARRAGGHRRAGRRRPPGDPARPGDRSQPRRPGVLVVRRAVPRRLPRAAPDGHQGLPRARLAGLAGHAPASTATEDHWPRALGRGLRRLRRRREAGLAARAGACGSSRSSAGPSAAATAPTGHGNSVPRFHITWGTGPGVVEPFERAGARRRSSAGWCGSRFRHRVDELIVDRRRGRPACAAACSRRATPPRGAASSPRRRSATFELARAGRRSSPPAASAATTTWSAQNWPARLGTPPRAHALRRARARRRPDARHHRGGRRAG